MSSSRGSSHPRKIFPPEPRSPALQVDSLSSEPPGKPEYRLYTHILTHAHTHTHAHTLSHTLPVAKTGCKHTAVFSLQAQSLGFHVVTCRGRTVPCYFFLSFFIEATMLQLSICRKKMTSLPLKKGTVKNMHWYILQLSFRINARTVTLTNESAAAAC